MHPESYTALLSFFPLPYRRVLAVYIITPSSRKVGSYEIGPLETTATPNKSGGYDLRSDVEPSALLLPHG